jgi:hypothetical protein
LQKFDGEDLGVKDRKRAQQEQLKNWLAKQYEEKTAKERAELEETRQYEAYSEHCAFVAHGVEQQVSEEKRRVKRELLEENKALAQARKEAERRRREEETRESLQQTQAIVSDPYLNEVEQTTISAVDPHRFRPDHFKHLRADQYAAILKERQQQIEDKRRIQEMERQEEKAWADYMAQNAKTAEIVERQVQREKQAIAKELLETQKAMAEEKKQRYDELFNSTYVNKVDDNFFKRFGTSCR